MKQLSFIVFFVCNLLICSAQTRINYSLFHSEHFSMMGNTACLFEKNGSPNRMKKLTFHPDTVLAFSYDPSVMYWSYKDSFYIHFVYFNNFKHVLYYDSFALDRKTTLKNVIDYFSVPMSDIDSTLGCMTPLDCRPKKKIFHIVLLDNSSSSPLWDTSLPNVLVDLYFDNKQRLLAAYFHYKWSVLP